MKPEQPGINGVRYASKTGYLYYTATAKKLFMRVKVDSETFEAAGEPELVVSGRMGDDFCLDEDAEVIYLTTHRQNTIDVVSMDPGLNSGFTQSVAGDPFTEHLIDHRAVPGGEARETTVVSPISSWMAGQRRRRLGVPGRHSVLESNSSPCPKNFQEQAHET